MQVSVSQASRRKFLDSSKILHNLQLSKSWIPNWPYGRPSDASGRPLVREDFEQLSIDSMNRLDDRATSSGRYFVFEKILNYAADTFGEDNLQFSGS
jgi:hypothetical protein